MTGGVASAADRPATDPAARRRWPPMTLRRRLVIAFAGLVTAAVVLVGGITYSATVTTLNAELDRALVSAAATIAAGGTVPVGDLLPDTGHGHGDDRDSAAATISVVQHVAADGTVTTLSGVTMGGRLSSGAVPGVFVIM